MKPRTKQLVESYGQLAPGELARAVGNRKQQLVQAQQHYDAALKAQKQQQRKQRESKRDPATGG